MLLRIISCNKGFRRARIFSSISALVENGKFITTLSKAKKIRPDIEKLFTIAKSGLSDSLVIRALIKKGLNLNLSKQLIKLSTQKYKDRPGGYLRIVKINYQLDQDSAIICCV